MITQFQDSHLRCPYDRKRMVIETDGEQTVHTCLNCDYKEHVAASGMVSIGRREPEYKSKPCKRCGAPVVWAKTLRGISIPVDAEPSERGAIQLQPGFNGVPVASVRPGRIGLHTKHPRNCTGAVSS